ncbi:Tyrosine--tRNA ligase 1 [compost metagenome]
MSSGINILDLLAVNTQVFPSKGEARKMLQGGGVSINREKATDIEQVINTSHLINNQYIIAQRGKKNYYLIIAE